MLRALIFLLVFALEPYVVVASPRAMNIRFAPAQPPKPTPPPSRNGTQASNDALRRRQTVTSLIGSSTCGYYDGDPKRSRTAAEGFGCRIDVDHGLWGFCHTTVIRASDCGLAGHCVDHNRCTDGCGKTGIEGLTTFSCKTDEYCSTVILDAGLEGGFSYIACGAKAATETLLKDPTAATVPSVTITPDPPTSSEPTTSNPTTESAPLSSAGTLEPSTQSIPPASEATSSSDEKSGEDSATGPNNTGAIVGGVVGGIAIVCITVVTALYLLRRNRRSEDPEEKPASGFFSWARLSQKPHNYDQSEASQRDSQPPFGTENTKPYAGLEPAEVHGSDAWRSPAAPVELPGAPPAELSGRHD